MIGTIVNTCAILIGTVIGTAFNRGIPERYKNVLYDGLGVVSIAIGLNAPGFKGFVYNQYFFHLRSS